MNAEALKLCVVGVVIAATGFVGVMSLEAGLVALAAQTVVPTVPTVATYPQVTVQQAQQLEVQR